MQERELFLSALDIDDPAARAAHLASACAGDADLQARVEALLASHEGPSQFLNTPAVEQITGDSRDGVEATILHGEDSTCDEEGGGGPSLEADSSRGDKQPPDDEIPLGFLRPSAQPGSLGRLGHYEVLEVIGRGAFGTVLRAFDEKLQRVVAIKVLAPEMAATSPARKRFKREAVSSAALRHENVVSIYAVEDGPIPYLVMEYIPGKTLQQRLDEQGPLDLPNVLRLGKQIADGLAAAHAEGLIHRDIKPGNILLEGGLEDCVKITDFGLARTADDASMTQSGVIAGTPMYMAPEQALGHKLDQRADLFSLGSVLYQMISGRPPFRAPSTMAVLKRVVDDAPRPIQEIIPETPTWMCELIGHLHAKNPDDRYATAKEVSELLSRCLADLQEGRTPTVPPPGHVADKASQADDLQVTRREAQPLWQRPIAKVAAVLILLLGGVSLIATQYWGRDDVVNDIPEETHQTLDLPPGSIAYKLASDEYKWTEPEQVVIGDDPQMTITNPFLSSDGQTLYFASYSNPAVGKEGLFFSRRAPDGQSWEAAEAFPAPINSKAQDGGPCVSADGKTLLFHSHRPDGEGGNDLWMATRASVDEPFGEVKNMGSTVNSKKWEVDPELSADGLTLVFISNHDGNNADVWMCQRETIGDPFGSPRNLGPAVNSPQAEFAPALSQDGTALLFTSNRNEKFRLWMSLRASDKESFGEARLLDIEKGNFDVAHPFLAVDGSELVLYFILWKDDSKTLWRTRRVPKDASDDQQPVPSVRSEPITWPSDAPPLAIAPLTQEQAKQIQKTWADWLGVPVEKELVLDGKDKDGLDIKLTLVLIPPGEFTMGSSAEEIAKFREEAKANGLVLQDFKWIELEGPQRRVRITRPFYISRTEFTNKQFRSFVLATHFKTEAEASGKGSWTLRQGRVVRDPAVNWHTASNTAPDSPVTHVTWNDANACCRWLTQQEAGLTFALPTEAQWEYACRAGTTTAWCFGDDEKLLNQYAVVKGGWRKVGTKKPNPFGLHDMHGNMWEWCRDSIGNYRDAGNVDPVGPDEKTRVLRGGNCFGGYGNNWHNNSGVRSAVRYEAPAGHSVMDKSFRVIAEISEELLQSKALPATRTYASGEWIDIIPLIDPKLDKWGVPRFTGTNQWRIENGELFVGHADKKFSKLVLPLKVNSSALECEFEFTRLAGDTGFCVDLPKVASGDYPVAVDPLHRDRKGRGGLAIGRGNVVVTTAPQLETGKRNTFRIEVRQQQGLHRITIWLNGKKLNDWTGRLDSLDGTNNEGYPHHQRVSLWCFGQGTELAFHRIRVRMLGGGTATSLRPVPADMSDLWPADAPPPAIAPFDAEQAKQHQQAWADYLGVPVEKEVVIGQDKDAKDVKLSMVLIPPGEFTMGSSDAERAKFLQEASRGGDLFAVKRIPDEGPARRIAITRPFYLSRHEVTVGQFQRFVKAQAYVTEAERDGKGGFGLKEGKWTQAPEFLWNVEIGLLEANDRPVVNVSWNDATALCAWLSEKSNGHSWMLPTESQWEYACRAGTTTPWCSGDTEEKLRNYARFGVGVSEGRLDVGRLRPNAFGLYDMHGNVWEWCAGQYNAESADDDSIVKYRPQRGGSWDYHARHCRSAFRSRNTPASRGHNLGFRLATALPEDVIQAKLAVPQSSP